MVLGVPVELVVDGGSICVSHESRLALILSLLQFLLVELLYFGGRRFLWLHTFFPLLLCQYLFGGPLWGLEEG